jgi:hypothetical protein
MNDLEAARVYSQMHEVFTTVLLVLFAILPPAVLVWRAVRPWRFSLWVTVVLLVLAGWGLILAVALLRETPDGGGAKVFALFFGWTYAAVWMAPWLVVYGFYQFIRGRRTRQWGGKERIREE